MAAQGYVELGMLEQAHAELDRLRAATQDKPEFLECRLFLYMQEKEWAKCVDVCQKLRHSAPLAATGYLQGAYCLHELGRTDEAREVLLTGPDELRAHSLFYYNLACYEAVLGEAEQARRHLRRAFEMEPDLRETAQEDRDLRSLRDAL
jgi:predicted Zn-dependent protease